MSRVRAISCVLLATGLAFACNREDASGSASATSGKQESKEERKQEKKAARTERPLPAFSGWTLEDERLDISSLIGKRMVVYFFDPAVEASGPVTEATTRIAKLRGEHNFEVVGVAVGSSRPKAKSFATDHGIDFPVLDDSSRRISARLGLDTPAALLGVDAEGYLIWAMTQFPTDSNAADMIESQMRTALRLPTADEAAPGDHPMAPQFTAAMLGRDERFDLASTRGQPLVLMFFLHTCSHCHEALRFLKTALAEMPEGKRPLLYGLELTGRSDAVRSKLRELDLEFFPVLFDDSGTVAAAYGSFAGVPDLMLIDREGRIAHRIQGWRGEVDGPVLRMRMAVLSGAPVPMLLRAKGYSGSEVCGVCHESEHQTWQLTNHSWAFTTLVKHGADSDPECVSCHVVGFGEASGFELDTKPRELENVGCESCHGRGGPHLSPNFASHDGDYQAVCLGCHDTKHSLGFEYATFLPKVSHAENTRVLALPSAERRRIVEERGAIRTDLLPMTARHVGSDACRSCHPKEHETWAASPHASALASLAAKGKAGDANCLKCHTTGFAREGGFSPGARAAEVPDLARVGCESCHGPGGDHIGEAAAKRGTIVSLGDKCDSCVILQICGSCHDDANDPGFEFEVQEKIDIIRHGTIEPGTGKPVPPRKDSARSVWPSETTLIARAFALRERRRVE